MFWIQSSYQSLFFLNWLRKKFVSIFFSLNISIAPMFVRNRCVPCLHTQRIGIEAREKERKKCHVVDISNYMWLSHFTLYSLLFIPQLFIVDCVLSIPVVAQGVWNLCCLIFFSDVFALVFMVFILFLSLSIFSYIRLVHSCIMFFYGYFT